MIHPSPPPVAVTVAVAKADRAWRGRTLVACGLLGSGMLGLGAVRLDWADGAAMALGEAAGVAAPLAGLGLVLWAACALASRRS